MYKFKKLSVLVLISAMATAAFAGCSNDLGPETLPSTEETTTTEETSVETETEAEETEETTAEATHGPYSEAVVTDRPIDLNGQLSISGTDIVNENGGIAALRGLSSYGLSNTTNFFNNEDIVQTLKEDWGADVLRIAMTVDDNSSSDYIRDPEKNFDRVCEAADTIIDAGMYVIIDWHVLYDGDPCEHKDEAIDFFSRISAIYADCPNVIYEICNEPNGPQFDDESAEVDWERIRSYATDVVAAIRANDPDNIIICGTPNWSQDVDIASENPLDDANVCYALHFYAGSHGQELRDKIITARDNGICVFVSEWGTTNDSGDGEIASDSADEWLAFLDECGISWVNWSIGGSNPEKSNALKFRNEKILTTEEKYAGHWPDEFLTNSGLYVRSKLWEAKGVSR